jgi:hypothetical protein
MCNYIYLEIKNKCKTFEDYVEKLYYTAYHMKNADFYYYPNLKKLMKYFLSELENDKYRRCIENLDKAINYIKSYIDIDPDHALLLIYNFCSKF